MRDWWAHAAVSCAMAVQGKRAHDHLLAQARDPAAAQATALQSILTALAHTEQAQRFNLKQIRDAHAFRQAVPIQDYEDIRPAIERQIAIGALAFAPTKPLMYARTSGTTGAPKYIPVTAQVLAQMRRAQRAMAYAQHRAVQPYAGGIVGLVGTQREETLPDGTPAGAATGLIYETMPRFMRSKYLIPQDVFTLSDYPSKYAAIARHAACSPHVSVIATANPSSVLRLMSVLRDQLDDIATHAEPARAAQLKALARQRETVTLADLWPGLRMVNTWLGGGCAVAAEAVRAQLPAGAMMIDAGYVASEVRGTIVMDVARNLALPLLDDVFFEFVSVADWESGERDTLLLHELEEGAAYHVVVTTAAGLLRYHMNDVLRVTGRISQTPTLQFVRKGRGVTNITGEKLSEDQVQSAMAALPVVPPFFIVLADAQRSAYRAYIDTDTPADDLALRLDAQLRLVNVEYDAKRASGRLGPLSVIRLNRMAADAYHRHCVDFKKQREAQAKVLALQTAQEFDFDFTPYEQPDARHAPAHR